MGMNYKKYLAIRCARISKAGPMKGIPGWVRNHWDFGIYRHRLTCGCIVKSLENLEDGKPKFQEQTVNNTPQRNWGGTLTLWR
jgi:hypothetical protein